MCGIAGYLAPAAVQGTASALRSMANRLAHRGPDDEGFFEAVTRAADYRIGLAHRRLSIIDLSTGHQPMGNEDGQIQIIFNGEIYNFAPLRKALIARGHQFATASDTETIVHAYEEWGSSCVERLAGMFAFAIWDSDRERLFLARDRFGKKPLFLFERGGLVLFGSEIKALLVWPGMRAELDRTALWDYFIHRYVPGPRTLFQGIRKLMPGCWALWERGQLTERRYYVPPDREARAQSKVPADPVDAFLDQLEDAVRIRMASDVPFGAFLSGGIDSSAVVGLMARHSSLPVKTFSVGFAEAQYSELHHARVIADRFRTEHHELVISETHLIDHLPALIRFRDAPVAEPSDIPIYLLAREARKSVKMVLTGEGSDEVLAGYPKHRFERYAEMYRHVPRSLRLNLIQPLISLLPYGFHRAKTAIATLGIERFEERMPRWFGGLSGSERDALVRLRPTCAEQVGVPFQSSPSNSALRRILYFDQTSWLPDNLLERGDRMTMAASLEARMPFLDHNLIALVSSLPDTFRLRGDTTKWVLREAMKRLLPPSILQRRKVGFRVPVNVWFRGPLRAYLFDHLTGAHSISRDYYDQRVLLRILEEHANGRQNNEKLLWCLLSLEIWHRECLVS